MYRARRRAQPPVPRTAAEFVAWMSNPLAENYNQHFKGAVELGTELAIIFMSTVIIPRLAEVQHAFFDATFFCVPVLFYQFFSIMAVFGDKALPVASVLMTGKSCTRRSLTKFVSYPLILHLMHSWAIMRWPVEMHSKHPFLLPEYVAVSFTTLKHCGVSARS